MTALVGGVITVSLLYLLLGGHFGKCEHVERTLEDLERMLTDATNYRTSRDSGKSLPIWLEYEFESGAGNREEIVITNTTLYHHRILPKSGLTWEYVESNDSKYLASANATVLTLHQLALTPNITMRELARLSVDGQILKFKILAMNALDVQTGTERIEILAVLCVESKNSGASLRWFRLSDLGFEIFWRIPVQKHVRDLEFLRDGDGVKILLLEGNDGRFGKQISPLDVCTVTIDFVNLDYSSWLCQTVLLPKAFGIRVCPTYERTLLALQGIDEVFLYEFQNTMKGILITPLETVKSHSLRNFVCFESGYIEYLAISGPQAGLYNFFENEFQFNSESEKHFELAEISWITNLPLDTYRDESLLLIQLKNSTVIALAWQGIGFERIALPDKNLDRIDLSTSTAIPHFGLVSGNIIIKFDITLKSLRRPIHDDTERIVKLQAVLKEVLEHQERILNETEERLNKSYLKNPVVTGFWNLTDVNVTTATINLNVDYQAAAIGSTNLTVKDLYFDPASQSRVLDKLDQQLEEIKSNLDGALDLSLSDLDLDSDLNVTGSIDVLGVLNVDDLTVDFINGNSAFATSASQKMIIQEGNSALEVLEAESLHVSAINGIPVDDIVFDSTRKNYTDFNFSSIDEVVVNGNLNFSRINGIEWSEFIGNVVWRNKPTFINESITINGTIFAEDLTIDVLNNQRYPDDYVLPNTSLPAVNVTGKKTIDKLTIQNLLAINSINDIDIEDFVVLNNENKLEHEITFEDLRIDKKLQVDGKLTGAEIPPNLTLNETTNVTARVIFMNLNVIGNVILEDSIGGKNWQDFKDLVQRTEENVKITGNKTFLGQVVIPNINITSSMINGRRIDEFLTIDTNQMLPNLEKIQGNVSFGKLRLGVLEKLERHLADCQTSGKSRKKLVFESPVTVDELSFERLNSKMSEDDFKKMLNDTLKTVEFDDLTVTTLVAVEILPEIVNNVNYSDSSSETDKMQEYFIENLEVGSLNVSTINALSKNDFETILNHLESFNQRLSSGNLSLESLQVKGKIHTNQINGESFAKLYNMAEHGTVVFEKDLSIETLNVTGFVNNVNLTKLVSESVFKTDKDIKFTGHKKFGNVTCDRLETMMINGRHVEKLFDPMKSQDLTGPITVHGSVKVAKSFEARGKLGKVAFRDFLERFKHTGNNTYELRGDFVFPQNASVQNISCPGTIGGVSFDEFLGMIVSKDADNVSISGVKTFRSPVTFNSTLFIHRELNDLDLKSFYEKAVYIDGPASINSRIIFESGIEVEGDLIVKKKFEAPILMGVDMNDLQNSVLYVNRPTVITDPTVLKNVTFRNNIRAEKINDIDTNLMIPLHTDQTISSDVLKCTNVTVSSLELAGTINSHSLDDIYRNTLMLFGDQTVTGHINFHGRVLVRSNFDPKFINGISPKQIALRDSEKLTGNFVFKKPVQLNGGLRVLGRLNDIDPQHWQATRISKNATYKQILSGNWTVLGNVHFGKDVSGLESLNGVNITEVIGTLTKTELEMQKTVVEQNGNLTIHCENLNRLKHYAEKQAYLFNTLEFLQKLSFNSSIVSLHHFEIDSRDYLFISHQTCHMNAFLFNGEEFQLVASVPDFGTIDQWTFKNDKVLYFLTMGNDLCGRGPVNLWKLERHQFVHVLDLGNRTHNGRINEDAFLTLINERIERRSIIHTNEEMRKFVSALPSNERMRFALDGDRAASTSRQSSYEQNKGYWSPSASEGSRDDNQVLNFKAGVFQKELFVFYDQQLSEKNVFICNYDVTQKKILQTFTAYKPSSFHAINLANKIETLLIFIENAAYIRVYEYKGIQGFVYRDTVKLKAERLYTFEMRRHANLARKNYIAAVNGNDLSILEVKMHGEKLDMASNPCESH